MKNRRPLPAQNEANVRPSATHPKKGVISIAMMALCAIAWAIGRARDARADVPANDSGFDRDAVWTVLSGVDVEQCKDKKTPAGEGHVIVTFRPNGTVSRVVVDSAPYSKLRAGRCIEGEFKKAKIPPFRGSAVRVGRKFQLD
jgi:hypothetical protein